MTQEIQKTETSLPQNKTLADMGIQARDLVIPRLLVMQNTSEAVGEDKAKLGDILNSQTLEVIGGLDHPIEIIPLKLWKTWRVMDMTTKNPKFLRNEDVNSKNENLPWEDNENGVTIRRDFTYNYYVLLVKDVAEGEAFPVVISFRRTSTQAGKGVATHLFKMAALGRAPYSQSVKLSVSKKKFETNTYAILECGKGEKVSDEGLAEAKKWLGLIGQMKVAEEAEEEPASKPAQAPIVVGGTVEESPY